MDVTNEVLDAFKAQVTRQGLESDTIIMGQDQGKKPTHTCIVTVSIATV